MDQERMNFWIPVGGAIVVWIWIFALILIENA